MEENEENINYRNYQYALIPCKTKIDNILKPISEASRDVWNIGLGIQNLFYKENKKNTNARGKILRPEISSYRNASLKYHNEIKNLSEEELDKYHKATDFILPPQYINLYYLNSKMITCVLDMIDGSVKTTKVNLKRKFLTGQLKKKKLYKRMKRFGFTDFWEYLKSPIIVGFKSYREYNGFNSKFFPIITIGEDSNGNFKGGISLEQFEENYYLLFNHIKREIDGDKSLIITKDILDEYAIKLVKDREIPEGSKIKKIIITRKLQDKYFVNFLVELNNIEVDEEWKSRPNCSIDLGYTIPIVLYSEGNYKEFYENTYKNEEELKLFKQKKLSNLRGIKKEEFSNNKKKNILKYSEMFYDMANKRLYNIYEIVDFLDKNFGYVFLENLTSESLAKNFKKVEGAEDSSLNKITRRIIQNSIMSKFLQILEYKLGKRLIKINPAYTSKMCSYCGSIGELSTDRVFNCPKCGLILNRDYNASKNIYTIGKQKLIDESLVNV